MLANLRDRYIVGKYLLRNYHRLWTAWVHFRRYSYFYRSDKHLRKLFGRQPRTAIGQACSYVLNNSPSFDYSYFPDMEKSFMQRLKELRAGESL